MFPQLGSAGLLPGGKNSRSDCYIELDVQGASGTNKATCTDGDPTCDTDGKCQGTCTFSVKVCLDQTNVAGCTPATFKKPPKVSQGLSAPQSGGASAVCSNSQSLEVALKHGGKKKGTKRVKATAIVNGKPKKETDQFTFTCMPREGACPTTTTSTTTSPVSSTTTTTVGPRCGDGVRNSISEECDGNDFGGATCASPGGALVCTAQCTIDRSQCKNVALTKLAFTNSAGTTNCGGITNNVTFTPPTSAPFSGEIDSDLACTTKIADLGLGCLYIGGGGASIVPPGATPDGATNIFDISGTNLVASNGTGPRDCTKGAGPAKHCIGGTNTGMTCTTDVDCDGLPGHCALDANCFFAAPLPIPNGSLTTCVINVIQTDAGGTGDLTTGTSTVTIPLSSRVYVTSNSASPCPKCVGGTCNAGPNSGLPCSAGSNSLGTTHDCPPDPATFLAPLTVTLDPLTTDAVQKTGAGGNFCPSPPAPDPQRNDGAFGKTNAQCIKEAGSPAGDLSDAQPHPGKLASVFCIPQAGNPAIDASADLPGPGAFSITGNAQALP